MKWLLIWVMVLGAGIVSGEEAPSLKHAGAPFQPTNFEIAWNAPTNRPTELWIYKTIPQRFSAGAISNLMFVGSFTELNERKPTNKERAADTNGIVFVSKDESRSLGISPALGWIFYHDNRAFDVRDKIEDVPSDATAKKLALKLLDQIGIPRSDLAKNANSSEPLTFWEAGTRGPAYNAKTKETIGTNQIYSRGIFFIRQIDGVNFAGIGVAGGFYVRFVSHEKVSELELVWRNLQQWEKYQVASPDKIIQWIKEGKAVMPVPNVNPSEIKKLTINQISPLYMGALGGEPQDFTYPFANLSAVAEMGQTNANVQIYCPILSTNIVRQ